MINDLSRLVKLGIITLDSIKDPSIRSQVEYVLNQQ